MQFLVIHNPNLFVPYRETKRPYNFLWNTLKLTKVVQEQKKSGFVFFCFFGLVFLDKFLEKMIEPITKYFIANL